MQNVAKNVTRRSETIITLMHGQQTTFENIFCKKRKFSWWAIYSFVARFSNIFAYYTIIQRNWAQKSQKVVGRQWYRGRASASCTNSPWFESRYERVLPFRFFHINVASTGWVSRKQTSSVINISLKCVAEYIYVGKCIEVDMLVNNCESHKFIGSQLNKILY